MLTALVHLEDPRLGGEFYSAMTDVFARIKHILDQVVQIEKHGIKLKVLLYEISWSKIFEQSKEVCEDIENNSEDSHQIITKITGCEDVTEADVHKRSNSNYLEGDRTDVELINTICNIGDETDSNDVNKDEQEIAGN